MKTLFDPKAHNEIQQRISKLTPETQAVWGKMNVAQMMAHCAATLRLANGDEKHPRSVMGLLFGRMAKPNQFDDKPFKRNLPTDGHIRITTPKEFNAERTALIALVDSFANGKEAAVTSHPHPFFGSMTPTQWGVSMYKHLDHHLSQFGV